VRGFYHAVRGLPRVYLPPARKGRRIVGRTAAAGKKKRNGKKKYKKKPSPYFIED
jgi:hypothetical protein